MSNWQVKQACQFFLLADLSDPQIQNCSVIHLISIVIANNNDNPQAYIILSDPQSLERSN